MPRRGGGTSSGLAIAGTYAVVVIVVATWSTEWINRIPIDYLVPTSGGWIFVIVGSVIIVITTWATVGRWPFFVLRISEFFNHKVVEFD